MWGRLLLAAGVGTFLAALGGCDSGTPSEYVSKEGRFKVMIPGSPQTKNSSVPVPGGQVMLYGVESKLRNGTEYAVAYADFPTVVSKAPVDLLLDNSVAGAASSGGWTSSSRTTIWLNGYPGREVAFELRSQTSNQKGIGRMRTILVNNRLYQVIGLGAASQVTPKALERFVRSFALVDVAPGPGQSQAHQAPPPPKAPPPRVAAAPPQQEAQSEEPKEDSGILKPPPPPTEFFSRKP